MPAEAPSQRADSSALASTAQVRADGAVFSLSSGLGTSRDPRSHLDIRGLTNPRLSKEQVESLMMDWGPRKYVEEIPSDATRRWIDLQVTGGPEDAAQRIKDRLEELHAQEVLTQCLIFSRQYGGAGLVPVMSAGAKAEEPLPRDENGRLATDVKIHRLEAVSRYRLLEPVGSGDVDEEPNSPGYGHPTHYRLLSTARRGGGEQRIHVSRLWVWLGWLPRERLYPYEWGWSILEVFADPWKSYDAAYGTGVALAQRMVETRMRIDKLRELIAQGKGAEIQAYLAEIQAARSAFRVFMTDKNDEVQDVELAISGAADLVTLARDNVAAASGLSASRFFGLKHDGLSDNDETGAQRDEAEIGRYQRSNLLGPLNWLIELIVREQGLEGVESWQVTFKPQREETEKQRVDRQALEAQAAATLVSAQVVLPDEVRAGMRARGDTPYQLQDDEEMAARRMLEEDLAIAQEEVMRLRAMLQDAGLPTDGPAMNPLDPSAEDPEQGTTGGPSLSLVPSEGGEERGAQPAAAPQPEGPGDVKVGVVKAAQELVVAVAEGTMPPESAIGLYEAMLGISRPQAEAIIMPAAKRAEAKGVTSGGEGINTPPSEQAPSEPAPERAPA